MRTELDPPAPVYEKYIKRILHNILFSNKHHRMIGAGDERKLLYYVYRSAVLVDVVLLVYCDYTRVVVPSPKFRPYLKTCTQY